MFNSLTSRKLYTEKELINLYEKTEMYVKKNLNEKDYRMTSFYSLDIAYILEMLHEERSINQFILTIHYAQKVATPLYNIITECLCNLGKFQEAFTLSLKDPYYNPLKQAYIYEKIGRKEKAHHIYIGIIDKKKKKVQSEIKFYKVHLFQEISDIWEKIGNEKESVKFNKHALEEWNKSKDSTECTHPIEDAWLSEEIGYIFEKFHLFEKALDYYSTAKERYIKAWSKDHIDYSESVQVNSQWDMHYREYFFTQLFPDYNVMGFLVQSYKDRDFKRIKYRILTLEEKMKSQ